MEWSGIRVMFALADEIPGVINLGIGQPDFDTPKFIREAAKKALDDGYTRYPPAKGFADLREAIAEKLRRENHIIADAASEIFVSVGAMQVIFNTILHLVEPGDEVIVIDPGYDYYSQIGLFGGVPVRVPAHEENLFKVDPTDVKAAVSPKTKLIILNSPSNPTGAVLDEFQLREIAALAYEHHIFVLSDEPYEHILFDGRRHISIASLEGMQALTISAFTLSKSYAMTGWRVGYVTAPRFIIDEMEKLMEHQVSGVTAVSQRAALAALTGSQDSVKEMLGEYEKRRAFVHKSLNEIDGVSCIQPEATFYAFPNISEVGLSSWDLAKYLVREHKLALIPGSIFGRNGEGYLRLSFAASEGELREGLSRIKAGVEALRASSNKKVSIQNHF
ncbi:MAG: pyridoxal phosphate-dependent aminotransferase [Anaerolineales bacterium]|nr:pyridoxal phosphate-dependent aminotransferase [Anaerolineales bacterium]